MRTKTAMWEAAAGELTVPVSMKSLLSSASEDALVYAIRGPASASVGVLEADGGIRWQQAMDAMLAAAGVSLAVVKGLREALVTPGVFFGPELTIDSGVLRLVAVAPGGVAADLGALKAAAAQVGQPWPAVLPEQGDVVAWSVVFRPDGGVGMEIERPAGADWMPAGAAEALRDVPELGAIRVAFQGDEVAFAARIAIDGETPFARWEVASIALGAYGLASSEALRSAAQPTAVWVSAEDAALELGALEQR